MTWATDNLRPASFRGIAFSVVQHEAAGGKAVVPHEFPGRDVPYVEELGRNARTFDVEAYLVGADYLERRDRLLEALQEPGAGELVHPWLGNLRVHARSWRIRESAREARMCLLAVSFVAAGTQVAPSSATVPGDQVRAAGATLLEQVAAEAIEILEGSLRPGAAAEGAADSWQAAGGELEKLELRGPLDKVAAWRERVRSLSDRAEQLAANPASLVGEIRSVFDDLQAAAGTPRNLVTNLDETARRLLELRGSKRHGGPAADEAADATSDLIVRNIAESAAQAAALRSWETYDDAVRNRQLVVELLDELGASASDAAYAAMQDLAAQLVEAVPPPDTNLPRLDQLTLQRTRPAIVLSYQLYDTALRDAEIVERNRVPNPAFLPTNQPLEVVVEVDG